MSDFATARDARWFEDYVPGAVHEFGRYVVGEDELLDFARRYDPQPFHIDEEAAAQTQYGGLITSGWHTCAMMMRMLVDHYISSVASLGSPGVDEVRWLRPVRPGDVLRVRVSVLDARVSRSKPDRGLVHSAIEVLDHDDNVVMTMKTLGFFLRRETATP
ncbi:MAG: MaoC family dehydratase [Gammaproteobacteria bacterium]